MVTEQSNFIVGDKVLVPTSELGKNFNSGIIKSIWHDKMMVDFGGKIGIYTISKHTIINRSRQFYFNYDLGIEEADMTVIWEYKGEKKWDFKEIEKIGEHFGMSFFANPLVTEGIEIRGISCVSQRID